MFRQVIPLLFCFPVGAIAEDVMICGGNEPSWSLEIRNDRASFDTPDTAAIVYEIPLITPARGRKWPQAWTLVGERDTAIAILGERSCSDTMSDTRYSHSIEFLTQSGAEAIMMSGCCRMIE